ncbi:TetR/AcrR family transcriptional regulator [Actinomadura opuntiae]|uniref:TetR/AcrR family transcriptional regulator n=1 Tax=Actinomadura sp. OS1-43 TaxID=604315 RepID=UPI00255B346D|nr:TetR/AcrR family transcriptional regulator [Actinomadura sp. OS1-43]MDL4821169.1 TetR/AcrR family transcriptional regulator [Actinomadura sp. OS1-43]
MSSARTPSEAAAPTRRAFDRDQALATALREFWTHGYDTTSIASLTEAMGIRPPSLYAAFGDKRQLFEEAVDLYSRTYGTAPARDLDARSAIAAMLRHLATDYTDPSHPPGCFIISAATNCGPGSQDVKAKLRAKREETKAAIAACIRADIDAGRLPATTDADGLAAFYAAVIQGMNQQACDGATRETLQHIADTAMTAWPTTEHAATPPTEHKK